MIKSLEPNFFHVNQSNKINTDVHHIKHTILMKNKLKNRMLILVTEKERHLGRRITQKEIAQDIGVSEPLVGRWMKNQVKQYDSEVLEKLCTYFNCDVGDLLYIDRNGQN